MTIVKALGQIWIVLDGDDYRLRLVNPETGELMYSSMELGLHYRGEV